MVIAATALTLYLRQKSLRQLFISVLTVVIFVFLLDFKGLVEAHSGVLLLQSDDLAVLHGLRVLDNWARREGIGAATNIVFQGQAFHTLV